MARIGGTAPDIYNLSTVWTAQLVQSDLLAVPPKDLSDFVQREYLAETREAMTTDGHVWGIPSEVNVDMLVYNKLLFARAGLSRPPATWDELVADAVKISKTNRQGQLTTAGFGFGPSPTQAVSPFLALLYSSGEPLFSADQRSTTLTTGAARSVLEEQVRLFRAKGTNIGVTPTQFPSGSLGMMIVPNWWKQELLQGLRERLPRRLALPPSRGERIGEPSSTDSMILLGC